MQITRINHTAINIHGRSEEADLIVRQFGEGRNRIVWLADPAGDTVELQQDPEC